MTLLLSAKPLAELSAKTMQDVELYVIKSSIVIINFKKKGTILTSYCVYFICFICISESCIVLAERSSDRIN